MVKLSIGYTKVPIVSQAKQNHYRVFDIIKSIVLLKSNRRFQCFGEKTKASELSDAFTYLLEHYAQRQMNA